MKNHGRYRGPGTRQFKLYSTTSFAQNRFFDSANNPLSFAIDLATQPLTLETLRSIAIARTLLLNSFLLPHAHKWKPTYAAVKRWAAYDGICRVDDETGRARHFMCMGVVKKDQLVPDWDWRAMMRKEAG